MIKYKCNTSCYQLFNLVMEARGLVCFKNQFNPPLSLKMSTAFKPEPYISCLTIPTFDYCLKFAFQYGNIVITL